MRHFHVSSSLNRESILRHGLDWARMDAAPGIAGSGEPEAAGIFLVAARSEADYFVAMNNTGGPVDVWAVDGIDPGSLVTSPNGYRYHPAVIAPEQVSLLSTDHPPVRQR